MTSSSQTFTLHDLDGLPKKEELTKLFVGKSIDTLRTPAFVIDRTIFAENCARMHENAKGWNAQFRAHLKTHKTAEGTRLQLQSSADKTTHVIVSTIMEAWKVVDAGLVKDGTIQDLLYGLPVAINKIEDLSNLWDEMAQYNGILRLIVDHPGQVRALEEFENKRSSSRRWSVFIKVDRGDKRAGVSVTSPHLQTLLAAALASPAVSIYGFYCHAGSSYASKSEEQASAFLSSEVEAVNAAAGLALEIFGGNQAKASEFVLSVGSTPTAHAATQENRNKLTTLLNGRLELHAGNYPLLDLQQIATSLVDTRRVAQKIMATVVSYYPGRGADGSDEAICDAGAIALSKDTGPSGDFGAVLGKPGWRVGRMSQEHGVLTRTNGEKDELELGTIIEIIGQHACLIAAAYPYYYIVDSSEGKSREVVDVWVPWKGW